MSRATKPKVNRRKKPINLTLSDGVKRMAAELMGDSYSYLGDLVEDLIRRKHEEVFGIHPKGPTASNATPTEAAMTETLKQTLAEPSDPSVAGQAGNPPNKTGDTPERDAGKKKKGQKPQ